MIRQVCSVLDLATRLYGQPFMVPATGAATRSFMDEIRRAAPDNQMHAHPEDFELWLIATFDDEQGKYDYPRDGATCLIRGKDCINKEA